MDNIKWFAGALVGAILVALLTVLLLVPQSIADFVSGASLALRLVIVILIYAVAAYLLYRQYQYPPVKGLVVRSSGTLATLNTESARDAIVKAIRDIDGVRAVRAEVKPARRGWAQIELRVAVKGDNISLPDKEQEINRALVQVAEKRLGLSLAKRPLVLITLGETESALDALKTPDKVDVAEPRTEVAAPVPDAEPSAEVLEKEETHEGGGLMGRFLKRDEPAEKAEAIKPDAKAPEPEATTADDPLATDEFYSFLKSTVPAGTPGAPVEQDVDVPPEPVEESEPGVEAATPPSMGGEFEPADHEAEPVNDAFEPQADDASDDAPLPPTVEPEAVSPPTAPADDVDDDSETWIVDEHITGPEADEDEPEENGPRRLE